MGFLIALVEFLTVWFGGAYLAGWGTAAPRRVFILWFFLSFMFSPLLGRRADELSQAAANAFIYTDAMKQAYVAQVAANKEIEMAVAEQRQLEEEHFKYAHDGAQNVQHEIDEEKAQRQALIEQLKAKQQALASVNREIQAQPAVGAPIESVK